MKGATLQFLEEIARNNNREWFNKNRSLYEDAKEDFLYFFENLVNQVAQFDHGIAKNMEISKKIFRIYRDVRFSKDKSPYKTHLSGAIVPGGLKSGLAGYYVHIQPGGQSGLAGGMHMLDSNTIQKVRKEISERFKEFQRIILSSNFKEEFGGLSMSNALKKVPRGFDVTNPAAEYLKLKSFGAWKCIPDNKVLESTFLNNTVQTFRELKKLNDFLNSAL
jgi:uncharacterized protein (TIGR02453 family)